MKYLIITGIIVVIIIITILIFQNKKSSPSILPITKDDPIIVVIEENESNFGHENVVAEGTHFPTRNDHVYNVFNESDPLLHALKLDTLSLYDMLTQDIGYLKPINSYFQLFKYTLWRREKPISTTEPSLSLSLFKPKLDQWDPYWASRYFASQLKMMMVFNYYFPKGSVRSYLCYYMMDFLKKYSDVEFDVGNIEEIPHCQFEDTQFNTNRLFQRFDTFMRDNPKKLNNALEKFMYYYTIASKIYNDTDDDDTILNNKGGDFFIYKFSGDFTERIRNYTTHITDGYIGQIMRYICLRQNNYTYRDSKIKRNTHFVFRDGHQNQTGPNDAENIKYFNMYVRKSKGKIFNMLPCDQYYTAPWHQFVSCPANPQEYKIRSAIAGVVQMANFTNTSYWLSDDIYYRTIGLAFLLNTDDQVAIKIHRPLQQKDNIILKEFNYGIEEYLFNTLFFHDYYKNRNIYYPDRFLWDVFRLHQDPLYNSWVEDSKPILKAQIILFLYLYRKNMLNEEFSAFDFFHAVEYLRWNPPTNYAEKFWLGFILSIYPTKYFIQQTIFNKGFEARNEGVVPPELQPINKSHVYDYLSHFPDFDTYNTPMDKWVWKNGFLGSPYKNPRGFTFEYLNNVTCNAPIINSNVEWCVDPYLYEKNACPVSTFFSGFYTDKPACLQYGMFRQPSELNNVIHVLENSTNIILYKNILKKTNPLLQLSSLSNMNKSIEDKSIEDSSKNWKDVFNAAM
jgi:hypothetical protein